MTSMTRRNFLGAAAAAELTAFGASVGGRPVRAQAVPGFIGRVAQVWKGDLKLHTYIAPEASVLVTTHVVETPNSLVVIDTQFVQTFAREARTYIDSLGKPVERVILSHSHPDHWLGGNFYTDVPYMTTDGIAGEVEANIAAGALQDVVALLGEAEVPSEPHIPEGGLTLGEVTIDGVRFEFELIARPAEATQAVIARLPDYGVAILQDFLYSDSHFFPGVNRANWLDQLRSFRMTLADYDTLLVGHGLPAGLGELDAGIDYLEFVLQAETEAASADELIAALTERFPTRGSSFILTFWQQFFQPA